MKNFKFLFVALLSFGIIGQLNAQTQSMNFNVPITVYMPCANGGAGEVVSGEVILHSIYHYNRDGQLTKEQHQPKGGLMIGETTGTHYRATGLTSFNYDNPNGTETFTFINRFHIVGPRGAKAHYFITAHSSTKPNGEVTVDFEKSELVCLE